MPQATAQRKPADKVEPTIIEKPVEELKAQVMEIAKDRQSTSDKLDELMASIGQMNRNMSAQNGKIEGISNDQVTLFTKLESIETGQQQLVTKVDKVSNEQKVLDGKIENIDKMTESERKRTDKKFADAFDRVTKMTGMDLAKEPEKDDRSRFQKVKDWRPRKPTKGEWKTVVVANGIEYATLVTLAQLAPVQVGNAVTAALFI